ncbi:MAG: PucC family protein, partial [Dolichospermum sp.]
AGGRAQSISRGIANVKGGTILDVGRTLLPDNLVLAAGLVFALEAVGLLVSIAFLNRVNVAEFQTNTKQALASVLESDLD